jgi:hypothetical protein
MFSFTREATQGFANQTKERFPLDKNFRFLVGTKLGVSNRLSCNGGKSSGRDLEITDFV